MYEPDLSYWFMVFSEEMGFIGREFISLEDDYPALILEKGGRHS